MLFGMYTLPIIVTAFSVSEYDRDELSTKKMDIFINWHSLLQERFHMLINC